MIDRLIITIALVGMCNMTTKCQVPELGFATEIAGTGTSRSFSLAVDHLGNTITIGFFSGTYDFDPGPASYEMVNNNSDVFIQKLDSNGVFVWAKKIGGSLVDGAFPLITYGLIREQGEIRVDGYGNIYVASIFLSDSLDLDPGSGEYIVTNAKQDIHNSTHDYFLVKLDPDGEFLWGHSFGGLGFEEVDAMAVSEFGSVYISGRYEDTVDFDPTPNEQIFISSEAPYKSGFMQKFYPDGTFAYAHDFHVDSTHRAIPLDIEVDGNGTLYVLGTFTGEFDFDFGPGVNELMDTSLYDPRGIFLFKADSSFNLIWLKQLPWASAGKASPDLAVSDNGNIALSVLWGGSSIDIDPSESDTLYVSSVGSYFSSYLLKLDNSGEMIWGGAFQCNPHGLDFGENEDLFIVSWIQGPPVVADTVDVDPTTEVFELTARSGTVAVIKLDSVGDLKWARSFGPLNGSWNTASMQVGENNSIHFSCSHSYAVDVDPSYTDSTIFLQSTQSNLHNVLVLKWNDTDLTTGFSDIKNAVDGYIYPNPCSERFKISHPFTNTKDLIVEIRKLDGTVIHSAPYTSGDDGVFDCPSIPGAYIVVLKADQVELPMLLINPN